MSLTQEHRKKAIASLVFTDKYIHRDKYSLLTRFSKVTEFSRNQLVINLCILKFITELS